MTSPTPTTINTESAVRDRYSAAANAREAELCCPVDYDAKYLEVIPTEIIERDYGCGDPSKHVRTGETVLDLGSGGGKICFIASQVVGTEGRVIGVDMNDTMLDLARRSQAVVAEKIGFSNVEFRKGKIQDLAIDRDAVDQYLAEHPVTDEAGLQRLEAFLDDQRLNHPMIPDGSIDVVVSNCVLNLVAPAEKEKLFAEIHRVLKVGGRAVISDIVCDEPVPQDMQNDEELWSGCISGAFEEHEFLAAFQRAGFQGVTLQTLQDSPWQTVRGIEFRSATVIAYKVADGECMEHNEAVMYRGPYSQVCDDDGHTFQRGKRIAVCRKTFDRMTAQPYAGDFIGIEPRETISEQDAKPFECTSGDAIRSPTVTKGKNFKLTIADDDCCGTDGCC
jgi:ubiquinone/menaquinone biosynthesis C-methylase UbiE